LATDIDPRAVQATRENCWRNGLVVGEQEGSPLPKVTVREASLPSLMERPTGYDVIVANILADVIVDVLQAGLAQLLAGHGILILGGIITGQAEEKVAAGLGQCRLRILERTVEGDWVTLVAAPS
jgi:ribosomal protein L11 methylase PrmA